VPGNHSLEKNASKWAVLAMACCHLGRTEEARHWLRRCEMSSDLSHRQATLAFQGNNNAGRYLGTDQWIIAYALTREAKALIDGPEALAAKEQRLAARYAELRRDVSERAEANVQRIVNRADDDPMPWIGRARLFAAEGNWTEAASAFSEATKLRPDNWELWKSLGEAHEKLDQWDKAIRDYNQAIHLAPENPALYRDRGNVYQQLKEWDKAIEDYRQAMKITPRYSWCWLRILDVEFARGASASTVQGLVTEAEVALGRPAVLDLVFQHAAWNLLLDRRREYENLCRQAAERFADSTNSMELALLARTAVLTNEPVLETEQLVEMASRAVEPKPAPWKEHVLSLCLLRDGQADAAIKRFNQSLGHNRMGEPLSWLGLAIAHAAAGHDNDAQDWLGKAQAWFEDNPLDPTSELPPPDRIECQLLLREAELLLGKSEREKDDVERDQEVSVTKPEPKHANVKPKKKQE
jgi:tetratricopeptide (TPR) repeat protein